MAKKKIVTGERKIEAREELGILIIRAGDIIRSAQSWQAKGEVDSIKSVNKQLQLIISGGKDFSLIKSQWEKFYKEVFGKSINFSDVPVPEAGFEYSWLIMNHPEITLEELHSGGKDPQPHWKYTDKKLDEVIDWTYGRDTIAQKEPYIIRVRPNIEADEDLKNKSTNQIDREKINTMTFKERLALGRFLYWSEGIILDKKVITLCSGSRYFDGFVPRVYWYDDEICVYWCGPGDASGHLRPRKAVSSPLET